MQHSTKNRQQKTRSGLRTKTGQVMSALAEFIKRPQADTQIGAEGIVEESAGDVKLYVRSLRRHPGRVRLCGEGNYSRLMP
jgi:hypothetical protein